MTDYLRDHWDGTTDHDEHGLARALHARPHASCGSNIRDFLQEGNGSCGCTRRAGPRGSCSWVRDRGTRRRRRRAVPGGAARPAIPGGFERVAEGGGVALYQGDRPRRLAELPTPQLPKSSSIGGSRVGSWKLTQLQNRRCDREVVVQPPRSILSPRKLVRSISPLPSAFCQRISPPTVHTSPTGKRMPPSTTGPTAYRRPRTGP